VIAPGLVQDELCGFGIPHVTQTWAIDHQIVVLAFRRAIEHAEALTAR
jgi:hypothetical protein